VRGIETIYIETRRQTQIPNLERNACAFSWATWHEAWLEKHVTCAGAAHVPPARSSLAQVGFAARASLVSTSQEARGIS
jgi:hypothetical protein